MSRIAILFSLLAIPAMASWFPSMRQDVQADANNSSAIAVAAGESFVGLKSSTLGVAGLQVSLMSDRNLTVFVQQSPDGVNWDLSDQYKYFAFRNFGITVQAISSYVRLVVTNQAATATGTFRLQTALCPIVEAVPRSLDEDGNLKVGVKSMKDLYGWEQEYTPMGEARVVEPLRLAGSGFGSSIDTNYWLTVSNNVTMVTTVNGTLNIASGTSAGNSAVVYSVRRGRYITGSACRYRAVGIASSGGTGNIRRWGVATPMPTFADGNWFFVSNGIFGVATMLNGTISVVTNGDFNGGAGAMLVVHPLDLVHAWEIYYTSRSTVFSMDDVVVHTVTATTTPLTSTKSFYAMHYSTNYAAASACTLNPWMASIYRLGRESGVPTWKHLTAGTAVVLKNNPGMLHRVVINSVGNNGGFTIYDATSAANVIGVVSVGSNGSLPQVMDYDLEFWNGLTITLTGTIDVTVIYE